MNTNNINRIRDKCCGCGSCLAICPTNAIHTERGLRGESVYTAGSECVNCGKCTKVCPVIKSKFNKESNIFYKSIVENRKVLEKSSSGGVAYEMARKIITEGGVVYAAIWNQEDQRVEHKKIDSLNDLPLIQGSKYIHSSISRFVYLDLLKEIKKRRVLFIGCPCQVSAIKNLVGTNKNLICIDLICHGVPSVEMWENQIKLLKMDSLESISFRRGTDFFLDLKDIKGKVYTKNGYDNPYYSLYLSFSSLRENCYSCFYARRQRVGDLTIGDFTENGQGYSCVLANNSLGEKLIDQTRGRINYEERNIDLLNENAALNHPTYKNNRVDKFTKKYNKYGLIYAYYSTFYFLVLKRAFRRVLGDKVYYGIVNKLKR